MIIFDYDKIYSIDDLDTLINKAKRRGISRGKKAVYSNSIISFDIETSSWKDEIDESYKDISLYNYLNGLTIRVFDTENLEKIKGLKFSVTNGYPIDELYIDLRLMYGNQFEETYDESRQIANIIDAYIMNKPVNENVVKHSLLYCWQFCIDGAFVFGRTIEDLITAFNTIAKINKGNSRVIVWVHNLAFEFQFIRKLFKWHKVFSISARKPIYAITTSNIEFRCTYILTNYSLEKLSEQLRIYKMIKAVGDLDYSLIRTPITPMSDIEINYCRLDVFVVAAYIQECIIKEKSIVNIPLTATGYCRRYVRHNCLYAGGSKNQRKVNKEYRTLMQALTIVNENEYKQLVRAFQGGFTHPSNIHSMKTLYNVSSIDFTSSYPYVLLSELYPMSRAQLVDIKNDDELNYYLRNYCCVFDVMLIGVESKYINEHYISTSHCYVKERVLSDNGRVVRADKILTTITNVDWKIINKVYTYDEKIIKNFRIYKRGYLPKPIIESIIKLYKDKTELKNVVGKEEEYLNAKALINAVFGMMVTAISKPDIVYKDDQWKVEPADIKKDIEKYNKSMKRFLFYPWGVFCTAYARVNLWRGICEFKDDYIYSDTDSIKCLNIEKHKLYIDSYNVECKRKLQRMCIKYNLNYDDLEPATIKGVKKPLGVWDYEGTYKKFKTLGAKRYLYLDADDELHMTVAGVNKEKAIPYLVNKYGDGVFDAFKIGLYIPPDYTGKLIHGYIDDVQMGVVTDYWYQDYNYISLSGIHLEKGDYNFDDKAGYRDYLKGIIYTK